MKKIQIALLAVATLLLSLTMVGCKRKQQLDLLHSLPQDASIVWVLDGASIYEKAGGEALQEVLGAPVFSQLSLLTKCIDVKHIVSFQEPIEEQLVITAKVTDAKGLKDLLLSASLSVKEEDGLYSTQIDDKALLFNDRQLWLAYNANSTEIAMESIKRTQEQLPSFADTKGIDKMFDGDIGFYINPVKSVKEMVVLFGVDTQTFADNRIVGNISFEKKDIKSYFEVIDREGKLFTGVVGKPMKIDSKILEYFPQSTNILFVQGSKNKDWQQAYEKLPATWRTPAMRTVLSNLNGTTAFGAKLAEIYELPETATIIAQVTKGKEKEVQQAVIELMGIAPEDLTYVDNIASLENFLFGTIFIGYVEGAVYISRSPIGINKPSFLENDLSRLAKDEKGYFLVDMRKGSSLNSVMQRTSLGEYYDLDAFIAFSSNGNTGELVFHNEASTDKNILEGIVRAIAKADRDSDLEETVVVDQGQEESDY